MALKKFHNFRLFRTSPKLSGNVKWDIVLDNPGMNNNLYISDFHLRPIAESIPYLPDVKDNLLVRPHEFNIRDFRKLISNDFYEYPIGAHLKTDWPWILTTQDLEKPYYEKHIKNWDDTYWAGTQRQSVDLYGKTHETLVPVWLERCEGLRFRFNIYPPVPGMKPLRTYNLEISEEAAQQENGRLYHKQFIRYFLNYLKFTKIFEGCDDVMSVNWDTGETFVRGVDMNSAAVVVKTDYNLVRDLKFRERPLMEQNSMFCNMLKENNLIIPNLFNFNFCFDFWQVVTNFIRDDYGICPSLKVNVEVDFLTRDVDGNQYWHTEQTKARTYEEMDTCTVKDIFTNHEEIIDLYDDNILDYMKDYQFTELMHKNKIVQPICHWEMTNSDGTLFNAYPGSINPLDILKYNLKWTTIAYGSGPEIEWVMNNYKRFIRDGGLQIVTGYTNGIRLEYGDDGEYGNIYIMLMTTDHNTNPENYKAGSSMKMHWPAEGGDLKKGAVMAFKTCEYVKSGNGYVDICKNYNNDPKFIQYPLLTEEEKYKDNVYGLWFCAKEIPSYSHDTKNDLICIIWTPSVEAPNPVVDEVRGSYNYDTVGGHVEYPWLGLPRIGEVLQIGLENLDWTQKPVWITELANMFKTTLDEESPSMVQFSNSLETRYDDTLSNWANEKLLYKREGSTANVRRYNSNIKPSFAPPPLTDPETGEFLKKYKFNYFYTKTALLSTLYPWQLDCHRFLSVDEDLNLMTYIPKKIAPRYPSLRYDVVQSICWPLTSDNGLRNDIHSNPIYDNAMRPKILDYFTTPSMTRWNKTLKDDKVEFEQIEDWDLGQLPEFKWFDESMICMLPLQKSYIIEITDNSKTGIEDKVLEVMNINMNGDGSGRMLDNYLLKKLYKFKYNLISAEPMKNPETNQYIKVPGTGEYMKDPKTMTPYVTQYGYFKVKKNYTVVKQDGQVVYGNDNILKNPGYDLDDNTGFLVDPYNHNWVIDPDSIEWKAEERPHKNTLMTGTVDINKYIESVADASYIYKDSLEYDLDPTTGEYMKDPNTGEFLRNPETEEVLYKYKYSFTATLR